MRPAVRLADAGRARRAWSPPETNGGGATNGVLDKEGRIWWPAINGLVRIDPKTRVRRRCPIEIDGRAIGPVPSGQDVPALTRDVKSTTRCPGIDPAQQVRFRYRLLPVRNGLGRCGRTHRILSALKPGQVPFRVQAARQHGQWLEGGSVREFVVAAAWYQTMWARVVGRLVAAALVLAPLATHPHSLRSRKAMLESEAANRTSELAASTASSILMARTDVLTGIANRREFGDRLAEQCQATTGVLAGVMIADIDDFKSYNDHYGQSGGMRACMRWRKPCKKCIAGRRRAGVPLWGRREFAVIARLPDTEAATTARLAAVRVAAVALG